MLSVEFHQGRRRILEEKLNDNSLTILFSGQAPIRSLDQPYRFSVNRNFYYLTGYSEEGSALLIRKKNSIITLELFVPRLDRRKQMFSGYEKSFEDLKKDHGINEIFYFDQLDDKLGRYLSESNYSCLYLDLQRQYYNQSAGTAIKFANTFKNNYPGLAVIDIFPIISAMRIYKEKEEIALIEQAVAATAIALNTILKSLRCGMVEYEIIALFNYTLQKNGIMENAFQPIVAAGKNALTLHYEGCQSMAQNGDLILFDVGAEVSFYAADISRTWPVSGRFSSRQRELYDIVEQANSETLKKLKVGMPHSEIENIGKNIIREGCKKIGLINDDDELKKYYWHGSGHYIGMDTHDAGDTNTILADGMALTLEPGLYIPEEGIGIRLEDTFVIEGGAIRVLSSNIAKKADEIEQIMANK